MESAVTAPVSGHVKRVVVQEGRRDKYQKITATEIHMLSTAGDSINQGDLTVEIVH
jgi:hypothetical protein